MSVHGYNVLIIIFLVMLLPDLGWLHYSNEACFTLKVKYICTKGVRNRCTAAGYYNYSIDDTPESVPLTLNCPSVKHAVIDSMDYSIPKLWTGSYYCPGVSKAACKKKQCSCCKKSTTRKWKTCSEIVTDNFDYNCKQKLGSCDITVPRYDFAFSNNNCLGYLDKCHEYEGTSWCYARWVKVRYHCVAGNTSLVGV